MDSPLKLYFFRHGKAEGHGLKDDSERALTAIGVRETQQAGQVLASLGVVPTRLLCSPRVRAKQTADILGSALGQTAVITDLLNFNFNLSALAELLAGLGKEDDVLFVGHEPSLSAIVTSLTGATIEMKRGGCALVNLDQLRALKGTLNWLVTPRIFNVFEHES